MGTVGQRVRYARTQAGLTQRELAQRIGIAAPSLSELENGRSATTTFLPQIERETGFSALWLGTGKGEPRKSNLASGEIQIPQYNVLASMGAGVMVQEHIEVVRAISVNIGDLRKLATFSAPENLSFITGYGNSMEPTFCDGDVLLIDQGINEVKFDAIYALERDNELFIKRLQRKIDGSLVMISDNKLYEPQTISRAEMLTFRVRGRVVLVWQARPA